MTAPKALADFEGTWRIVRRINDHRARSTITGEGSAVFSPEGAGLLYTEELQLQFPGQPAIQGSRRYCWAEADGHVQVVFADGRPFHRIDLDMDVPEDVHHCDPDTYAVTYDLKGWPDWSTVWRVAGPNKNYTMATSFTRS